MDVIKVIKAYADPTIPNAELPKYLPTIQVLRCYTYAEADFRKS